MRNADPRGRAHWREPGWADTDHLRRMREMQEEGEGAWIERTNWLGAPLEPFEGWLINRWLGQIRGGRFRQTRQFQKMVEAYERERQEEEDHG